LADGGGVAGGGRLAGRATATGSVAFISGTLASDVPNPPAPARPGWTVRAQPPSAAVR
jgi:hypothetical protein